MSSPSEPEPLPEAPQVDSEGPFPRIAAEAPRFLRRLPLAALAAFLAWAAVIGPAQGRLVAYLAEGVVRVCESPALTFFRWERGRIEVTRPDLPESGGVVVSLAPVTMNLALLLALVWATPRSMSRGLPAVLLAVGVLLLTNVAHLALTVGAWYATALAEWSLSRFSRLERELLGTSRYLFDVLLKFAIPLALWLLTIAPANADGEAAGGRRVGGRKRREG